MRRARTPVGIAEVFFARRVKIPFHRVAFPKVIVIGVVGGFGVQRAHGGVERLVVPHVKKLYGAVFQVVVEIFQRGAHHVLERREVTVNFHAFRRARGDAAHPGSQWLDGGELSNGEKQCGSDEKNFRFHGLMVDEFIKTEIQRATEDYFVGFVTRPMKSMLPECVSRIRKRNGRSARKVGTGWGLNTASDRIATPVAAAASVPCSSTSTNAL